MLKLLKRFSGELVLILTLLLVVNGSLVGFVYGHHNPDHDGGNPNASASPEASPSASPSDNPGQGGGRDERVPLSICHATHSEDNPFTTQTVDDDSVDGIGEGNGQSADHNRDDHQDGEDIIPPGPWDPDGRNWTEDNQAIWNNNCNSIDPSASPSVEPSSSPAGNHSSYLNLDGPRCDSTTFTAKVRLTVDNVAASEVPVTFTYQGSSLPGTTDSNGEAWVTFTFFSPGTVTVTNSGGFPDSSGEVKPADLCSGGTGGLVLGASTSDPAAGSVLGVSTLADTGSFEQTAVSLLFTAAAAMMWVGVRLYGTKNSKTQNLQNSK